MDEMPGYAGHDAGDGLPRWYKGAVAGGFSGREHFSASGTKNQRNGVPMTDRIVAILKIGPKCGRRAEKTAAILKLPPI